MTDVRELRELLAAEAERAPDGAGMLTDVRAGAARLRQRRRRTTIGAVTGAVAVAAVVTPLTLLGARDTGVTPRPIGPARPTETTGARSVSGSAEITLGIADNPKYRVTDATLEPGLTQLRVWPYDVAGVDTTSGDQMVDPRYRSADLKLLAPDRFDPTRMREKGQRVTVQGHPAWYIPRLDEGAQPEATPDPPAGQVPTPFENAVGWEAQNGSWLLLEGGHRLPREELLALAELVREVPGRTIAGPIGLPYVPAGVRPWFASAMGGDDRGYGNQRLSMTFALPGTPPPAADPGVPADVVQVGAYENPTEVMAHISAWGPRARVDGKEIWHLDGSDVPTVLGVPVVAGAADQREVVVVRAAGCVVTIGVTDRRKLAPAELDRMARQAVVGDCALPWTWRPVL